MREHYIQNHFNALSHFFSSPVAAQGLCAYAFKLSSDPHRGMLAFLRVYSGTLRPHTSLYNINRNTQSVQSNICEPQFLLLSSFSPSCSHCLNGPQGKGESGLAGTGWGPARSGRSWGGQYCSGRGPQAGELSPPAGVPLSSLPLTLPSDMHWRHSCAVSCCGKSFGKGSGWGTLASSTHHSTASLLLHSGANLRSGAER